MRGKQLPSAGLFNSFFFINYFPPASKRLFLFVHSMLFPLINGGENFATIWECLGEHEKLRRGCGFENLKYYISCLTDIFVLLTAVLFFPRVFRLLYMRVIKLFYFSGPAFCLSIVINLLWVCRKAVISGTISSKIFSALCMINYFHFVTISHIHDGTRVGEF